MPMARLHHLVGALRIDCLSRSSCSHRCTMGPSLPAFMPSGSSEDCVRHLPEVLVAIYGVGGLGVHKGMYGLCQKQDILQVLQGSVAAASQPLRTWSDISLDFVMGLPVSQGNTAVLTVMDRFSKMARIIPLPKLPSAKETAEVTMNQVFRVHGFPKDIVSDRGPQFVSRFLEGVLQAHRSYGQPDLGTTRRRTARPNALISRWKLVSGAWSPRIPPHGANTWSGLRMLIILGLHLLLVCLLFIVFSATNLQFFQPTSWR